MRYLRDGRAPKPKSTTISRVMSANRAKNTEPEKIVQSILRKGDFPKFRKNPSNLLGRPDIVFPKENLVLFVNGCYWHRCPYCKDGLPKTHRGFWRKKFETNVLRDRRIKARLKKEGWKVLVLWECQIRKRPGPTSNRILRALVPVRKFK